MVVGSDPSRCPCCDTPWCDKNCPGWVEARRYRQMCDEYREQLSAICLMLESEGRGMSDRLFRLAAGLPLPPTQGGEQ